MGNANIVGRPTIEQFRALQITRTVASIPSILGASYIIQHVVRSKKRRKHILTRILVGMSSMDLLFALTTVFSSTIVPKDSRTLPGSFAIGTWATCQAFGFLGQGSSLSSILYNASLTLFYLFTIRYGWSEWRMRHLQPWLHIIPLLIGWGTAVAALGLKLYNPTSVGCNIASYPWLCETAKNPTPCQRGKHANIFRLVFLDVWVWSVFLFLIVCMTLIYLRVSKIDRSTPLQVSQQSIEQQQANYHLPNNVSVASSSACTTSIPTEPAALTIRAKPPQILSKEWKRRHGRKLNRLKQEFATQALLYCLAYGITWLFFTIGHILKVTDSPTYIPIIFLINILQPLQGFWNAFIYIRPRYLRYRRKQRQEAERQQQAAHVAAQRGVAFFRAVSVMPNDADNENQENDDYILENEALESEDSPVQ